MSKLAHERPSPPDPGAVSDEASASPAAAEEETRPKLAFGDPDVLSRLERATPGELDDLDFGVIGMTHGGVLRAYNRYESEAAGLRPEGVLGKHFFTAVAPCTNNQVIAHRFMSAGELDETIDYTFVFRLRATRVRLRLLRSAAAESMYLLVNRRT